MPSNLKVGQYRQTPTGTTIRIVKITGTTVYVKYFNTSFITDYPINYIERTYPKTNIYYNSPLYKAINNLE